jgi:prophage maintenance system killer protein
VFLKINGVTLTVDEPALGDLVLALAAGQADKAAVIRYFRERVRPAGE